VDRAIVKALCPTLNVPKPDAEESPGREAAIRRAATAAKLSGYRIALLLDKNGRSSEQLKEEISGVFTKIWGRPPESKGDWWVLGQSGVRLILAGMPGDESLLSLGIMKFTADDYLLKLCLNDRSLKSFCDGEGNLSYNPANSEVLREVLVEQVGLLRKRGITIDSSKRHLHLVRAILGFEASRAKMAEHLIKRCATEIRDAVLGKLRQELETDPAF
jgi:hypothetical protein